MALDLGLTTRQLLSALDDVALASRTHAQRLNDTLARGLNRSADAAARRTAAVGRRPYLSASTGLEGLLGSRPPPDVPADWTALSVDGSHIAVDRHLPLRCHLINLGGCVITYGKDFGCQLFSEPALAVADADLYLRKPDDPSDEVLIAGPLLGALRTVLEVERLADAVEQLPDDKPALALLDGTLAFWDLQRGNYPRYVAEHLVGQRFQTALARLRAASIDHRPVAVAAPTPHGPAPPRGRRRAPHGLRAGRRRLQPSLHHPRLRPGVLRRLRRLRRPRVVRACAGTGTPVAPVPVHPPGGALRPGLGHRPGVEPLLLPQRRRRDRPRRGPRLAGQRPRAARPQPCHAGETVPAGPGPIPWSSPRPTSRPSSPATTVPSSAA